MFPNSSHLVVYGVICVVITSLMEGYDCRNSLTSKKIGSEKRSVGPVASCEGSLVDMGAELRMCYSRCSGYEEPKLGVKMAIYQSDTKGPNMVSCARIRLTQSFTQTWTFSTFKNTPTFKVEPMLTHECQEAIRTKCPNKVCDIRTPSEAPEEYHYASTTDVTVEIIELISMQGLLFIEEGTEMISPMGTNHKFHASYAHGRGGVYTYIWDSPDTMKKCPYTGLGVYGCDEFDEKDDKFYACSGGGMTVTPKRPELHVHKTLCPGIMISEEGFLYSFMTADASDKAAGRLALTPQGAETADALYSRHKLQQVAHQLDSDICFTQCEIMSLETRASNKSEHLTRVGHDHFLVFKNGSGLRCSQLQHCHMSDPKIYCGSPPRVGIYCNGHSRLWDPLLPYVTLDSRCPRPETNENLTFNLGTSLYDVSNKLEINVPVNELHGVYRSEFMRYHNLRTSFDVSELNTIGDEWRLAKKEKLIASKDDVKTKTVNSPHVQLGSWVVDTVNGLGSWISSIEAVVGAVLVFIVVLLSVGLLVKIIHLFKGSLPRRPQNNDGRTTVSYSAVPDGASASPSWT